MKKIIIILISIVGFAACEKNRPVSLGPQPIALCATIENIGIGTKAPYTLTVPTSKDSLTAAIWASTTRKSYKGSQKKEPNPDSTNVVDYHNSTCFTSGARQLLDHQLFYPNKDGHKDSVFFVGFCPRSQEGWSVEGTVKSAGDTLWNIARFQFDGKTDVMFAGEKGNNIDFSSRDLSLNFRHVLTWLRFHVVADEEAISAWGYVKKITIESKSVIKINVSSETCTFDTPDNVFRTYCIDKGTYTDTEFADQNIELATSTQDVAYSLCAAVEAAAGDGNNEYTITIETQYRPETKVAVNLKAEGNTEDFIGSTGGRLFDVTLRFKLGDNVTTTASVSEWKNAGIGVAPIVE